MYCVGVSGNIGSGKSTAVRIFKSLGISVICADSIARHLTAAGSPSLQSIQAYFGDHVVEHSGELNRALIKKIIFETPEHRVWLENLLHPLIRKEIKQQVLQCKSPYCVIEIPLLTQREDYPYLNRVLVILANPEKQILRMMHRDNISHSEARVILGTQPDEASRRKLADDVIMNNGTVDELRENVQVLHNHYISLASLDASRGKN